VAEYRFAALPDDAGLLDRARAVAADVLAADPRLTAPEHGLLAIALHLADPDLREAIAA
jgi:hypothetical protein